MKLSLFDILKFTISPVVFVVVLLIGIPVVKMRPTSYMASAKIWIQAQYPKSGAEDAHESSGLYLPFTSFFNSPIKTAGEIIHSDLVLTYAHQEAAKQLPKGQCPRIAAIKSALKTEEVKDTDVISLSYSASKPKVAYLVLKGVVDGFLDLNSVQSAANAIRTRTFLEQQISLLRAKLQITESKIKEFQLENKTLDIPQVVASKMTRIATIEDAIQATRVEISQKTKLIEFLKGRNQPHSETAAAIRTDATVQELESSLAKLEASSAQLSSNLHDTHPRLRSIKSQIQSTQHALNSRIEFLRNSQARVRNSDSIEHRDMLNVGKTAEDLTQLESDMVGLHETLAAQTRELENCKGQLTNIPSKQLVAAELTRLETTQLNDLSILESKLNMARMVETVAAGVTNIQVIDPPKVPSESAGPNPELIILATGLLALVLSVGTFFLIHFLDPTVTKASDLQDLPEFQLIGAIPITDRNELLPPTTVFFDRLKLILLQFLDPEEKLLCILSSSKNSGKTALAIGLSKVFAASGKKICLVETTEYNQEFVDAVKTLSAKTIQEHCANSPYVFTGQAEQNIWFITPAKDAVVDKTLLNASVADFFFDYVIFDTLSTEESGTAFSLLADGAVPIIAIRIKNTLKSSLAQLTEQLRLQNIQRGVLVTTGTKKLLRGHESYANRPSKQEAEKTVTKDDSDELWS